MTIEELEEIVRVADKKAINEKLRGLGYIDCKRHKELGKISLDTLFRGELSETECFLDVKHKRYYQGGIMTEVAGYEQIEFIIVSINDPKHTFPIDMLIWAK